MAGTVVAHYEDGSGLADLPCSRLRLTSTTPTEDYRRLLASRDRRPLAPKAQCQADRARVSVDGPWRGRATVAGVTAPSFVAL